MLMPHCTGVRGGVAVSLCLSIGLFAPAEAEDIALAVEAPVRLPPVVTYGTRQVRDTFGLPYAVSILDAEALERLVPRTLPESLASLPGVLVQKTASGHGSPYVRGFTGNRTLAVIDGIRYNNATYRDGANEYYSHIDTFTIDQVEVLSGPASTLYGSEAVGGTIILTTRKSRFAEESGAFFHGEQIVRVSSGDDSIVSRTAVEMGEGESWGLRLGVSAKEFGDVRAAGTGPLPYTGYGEQSHDARFDARLGGDWRLTAAYQKLLQDDVPRTHSTIFAVPFAGSTAGTDLKRDKDQARSLTYVKLAGEPKNYGIDSVEVTLSYQPRSEDELRIRSNGVNIRESFDSDLWALSSVFQSDLAGVALTYGADLSFESVESARSDFDPVRQTTTRRIQGPFGDDASYQQIGAFLTAQWQVTDDFDFEIGGRYSRVGIDVGRFEDPATNLPISFADDWDDVSGSIRSSYRPAEDTTLWGAVSQSFRAPNIADVSRFGQSRSNEFEVASFDLKPEEFLTTEIGYRYSAGGFSASVNAYHTSLDNYIDTLPTGRVVDGLFEVSKQNSASGSIDGIELASTFVILPNFDIAVNATWLEGTLTRPAGGGAAGNVTEPISRIQPLTANVAINWSKGPFWVSGELSAVQKANSLSDADRSDTQRIPPGGTPGHVLLGLKGGWEFRDNVQITISLINLLDEAFRAHGSGSNEPGRSVTASVRLSF